MTDLDDASPGERCAGRFGGIGPGAVDGAGVTDTAFGAAALELGRASIEPGRAYQALERVMAGVLVAMRGVACGLSVFYLFVWDWYDTHPAAAAMVVAAVTWDIVFCVISLRRGVGRPLAAVSVALALALALTARDWLPPESVGDTGNFVFLAAINGAAAAVWAFPPAVAAGLVLLLGGGALTGGWGHFPQAIADTVVLVITPGLFGLSVGRLREIAHTADRRWANVVARHRGEAVVLAVARDRRERERIIHDTVLNTLTGIAWGGGRDVELARRRCGQSLVAVEGLLDPDGLGGPSINERLAEVVGEAAGRGLIITLDTGGGGTGGGTGGGGTGGGGIVEPPAVVVAAFAGAVREALANVERHAGTRRARVRVDGGPDVLIVRVSDSGRGFDPRLVDPARLGLRRSIAGRLEDVAGTVTITSAPGAGTTVDLRWQRPVRPADAACPGVGEGPPRALRRRVTALLIGAGTDVPGGARGGFVPDRRGVTAIAADLVADYAAGVRRAVGHVAGLWLLIMLAPLVATLGWVRVPLLAGALWTALAALIVVTAVRIRTRPLSGAEAGGLLVASLAIAVVASENSRGADIVRIADWPLLVVPLLLAFITASRPTREWVGALAATIVLFVGLVLARDPGSPLVLARLGSTLYGTCAVQIITAMLGPLLRGTAVATARTLAAEAEIAAHADSASMIRRERLAWLGAVQRDALPLLAGVVDGRLDPRTPAVRSGCAVRAAAIRRMLTGGGPSSALADLDPVLADAEGAGIGLVVQRDGDLRTAPAAVRVALADRVGEVLAAAQGGRAFVTVLWAASGGSVVVGMPWPDRAPPTVSAPATDPLAELQVHVEVADRWLSLELTWASS
ncbi:sensor histidine kinase [Frankia canadensis]|uniref:sensor histidine kinase n=1 Tax=Frankia canadensis TaxID=1836972 RepID=UPI001054EEF2|nr:ATP-binding protein [Frankia canadensis]